MESTGFKLPDKQITRCSICNSQYYICRDCGISHGIGSANAEHLISYHGIMGPNTEGFYAKSTSDHYQPWEAPAPQCPFCWHKEHPEQKEAILSNFGLLAKTEMFKHGNIPANEIIDIIKDTKREEK
jgi:hypothetical protein